MSVAPFSHLDGELRVLALTRGLRGVVPDRLPSLATRLLAYAEAGLSVAQLDLRDDAEALRRMTLFPQHVVAVPFSPALGVAA